MDAPDNRSRSLLRSRKIGFIGAGNLAQAMIKALVESETIDPKKIFVSNRSSGKVLKLQEQFGIVPMPTNEQLIDMCDIVILAVKPQDLTAALEPIASSFHQSHLVISLAAGYSLETLERLIPNAGGVARAMANTPSTISKGVIGYCLAEGAEMYEGTIEDLLSTFGLVVPTEEGENFEALTVSCACGTGFVLELMQYWQEWIEEHGFDADLARKMVVQTFLGAAALAEQSEPTTLAELQDRVTSKKGVTAAGLHSMRELEIERTLRYSFEKAALRDQEISRGTSKQ